MRLRALYIIVLFLLAMWPASQVHAEEKWSDDIDNHIDWTADKDPYIVTKSITIEKGAALTIRPGVTVKLRPGVVIEVFGDLRARGTEDEPITFTWDSEGRRWGSITQRGGKVTFNFVNLSHANIGILTQGWGKGADVFSSVFRDNGIAMQNDMAGGDQDGFTLEVLHTLVTRNTIGIIFNGGTTRLYRNNISENIEQGIGAFTKGIIERNTIYANGTDGIENGDPRRKSRSCNSQEHHQLQRVWGA